MTVDVTIAVPVQKGAARVRKSELDLPKPAKKVIKGLHLVPMGFANACLIEA